LRPFLTLPPSYFPQLGGPRRLHFFYFSHLPVYLFSILRGSLSIFNIPPPTIRVPFPVCAFKVSKPVLSPSKTPILPAFFSSEPFFLSPSQLRASDSCPSIYCSRLNCSLLFFFYPRLITLVSGFSRLFLSSAIRCLIFSLSSHYPYALLRDLHKRLPILPIQSHRPNYSDTFHVPHSETQSAFVLYPLEVFFRVVPQCFTTGPLRPFFTSGFFFSSLDDFRGKTLAILFPPLRLTEVRQL